MTLPAPMDAPPLHLLKSDNTKTVVFKHILADRTNGRAYATVLRLSSVRLWHYVLWLNGAS